MMMTLAVIAPSAPAPDELEERIDNRGFPGFPEIPGHLRQTRR
jgi:hypothetical protein